MANAGSDEFPRRSAITRGFTLGAPRSFRVAPDGDRLTFLRSSAADDPVQSLWVLDLATNEPGRPERCVADPRLLASAGPIDLPPAERARRERARERAGGIVAYATDRHLRVAAFALGGQVHVCDLDSGVTRPLEGADGAVDPRPDPSGQRVAWAANGALHVASLNDGASRVLASEDDPEVTWGLAEFIAAEEMERSRGFWWSPAGDQLAASRVDARPVQRWHLGEPADPARPPTTLAYPAAGTANADVALWVITLDDGRTEVVWDRAAFPYLASVRWDADAPLTLAVQSRDQRTLRVLSADPESGTTRLVRDLTGQPWVDLVDGLPCWLPDGRLLHHDNDDDSGRETRRLAIDGQHVSRAGLHIRRLIEADEASATVVASADDPTHIGIWRLPLDGGQPERLSDAAGVHEAVVGKQTVVMLSSDLESAGSRAVVRHAGGSRTIASHADQAVLRPRVRMLELGRRRLRAALLLPSWYSSDDALPVLLDPYGGPHAQRVLQRRDGFLTSQWFAEAGLAVLVTDGRGTPGRGPAWEHAVSGDLATAPLEDQIDALHAAAEVAPFDLERVAIRGWSFGGYLAALAVLRRPDVFAAGIAGAPVTDWRLYDTHYTERYLGDPLDDDEPYRRSSLLDDAARLSRPLLLIHGLADDNVVAAHTLRLSQALLEAGRPHRVLPLSGITHMASEVTVAENLLRLQLEFLRETLDVSREQR